MADLKIKCKCGAIHSFFLDDDGNLKSKANYKNSVLSKKADDDEKNKLADKSTDADKTASKIKYFISGNDEYLPSEEEEE